MGHHRIDRQHDLAIVLRRLRHDVAGGGNEIVLGERLADRLAVCRQESVRHRAADDQRVDFGEQVPEQVEFGRDFRAADDRGERALRRVEGARQRGELCLHGTPGIGRQMMPEPFGRGMGTVRGRERVVDPEVAEFCQRGDETGLVFLLAAVEAGVLEAQHVAGPERRDRGFRRRPDAVRRKRDRTLDHARDCLGHRAQRLRRIRPLGPAKVGEQDDLAALLSDLRDGRGDALDPGRVGDLPVLHRHVEVDPHQHAFAADLGFIESAEPAHLGPGAFVRSISPSRPPCRPCGSRSPTRCRTRTSPARTCRP